MPKLKLEDLAIIKERVKKSTYIREGAGRAKITVHMGTCGIASGARNIMTAFLNRIESGGVTDVIITTSGCAGLCSREPMATVEISDKPPVKYHDLTKERAEEIFDKHIQQGQVVTEYALAYGSETTDKV